MMRPRSFVRFTRLFSGGSGFASASEQQQLVMAPFTRVEEEAERLAKWERAKEEAERLAEWKALECRMATLEEEYKKIMEYKKKMG